MHVVVCYVVHSFHQQMAYATPSQIKKVLNFIATHRGTHTSGFDQKQNQKAGTISQWEQNHFVFLHSVSVGTIPLLWLYDYRKLEADFFKNGKVSRNNSNFTFIALAYNILVSNWKPYLFKTEFIKNMN